MIVLKKVNISSFGKVLLKFGTTQAIANFLRIISGFLVVRLLEPELYGQFSGIGVYLGYFALLQLGMINGLSREFPYFKGKGEEEYSKQLANTSFVVTSLIGVITALVFLSFSIYSFANNDHQLALVYLTYGIIGGLDLFIHQFLVALYRTSSDFGKLSKQNIIVGVWNLLSVAFVWFYGFYGLLLRGVFLAGVQFILLYKHKPYPLLFNLHFGDLKLLLKTGFPIFILGQINPLWSTIVNNIIFSFGGARYFGLYALANIVQTSMNIVPKSFSQVIYPRMSIMYGQGKTPQQIIRLNAKPLFFQFFVMLGIAVSGAIAMPYIVPYLLPKYADGIEAAQWIMFVPVILSFGAINNIFNVIKKQKYFYLSMFTGAILGTAIIYYKMKTMVDFDLLIFPQGMILGKLVQQLMSLFFALRLK